MTVVCKKKLGEMRAPERIQREKFKNDFFKKWMEKFMKRDINA